MSPDVPLPQVFLRGRGAPAEGLALVEGTADIEVEDGQDRDGKDEVDQQVDAVHVPLKVKPLLVST